ncbi:MAG: DUF1579 domain-containing protein [Planctomycetota bacterium]|nr:DUF1579 domain-containing protein [Planctomycetota bacterium]
MKKTIAMFAVLASLGVWSAYSSAGDEKGEKKSAADAAQDAMMQAWMKLAEPGEHHEHLKVLAGTWKTTTKYWMGSGEPDISQGVSKNTWILGGRFLQMEFKSTTGEHPFEGFGLLGYDNTKKQHVSVWCDTMGTGASVSHGTCDDSGKVFTYVATYDDPMTQQPKTSKWVTKVINDKKYVFTIHSIGKDGKETQELEVTYLRAG